MDEQRMRDKEILDRYGTVAFSRDVMLQTIGWGEAVLDDEGFWVIDEKKKPTQICFSIWLAVVPKVYRAQVTRITERVGKRYLGMLKSDYLLKTIVADSLGAILREVEPVPWRTCEEVLTAGEPPIKQRWDLTSPEEASVELTLITKEDGEKKVLCIEGVRSFDWIYDGNEQSLTLTVKVVKRPPLEFISLDTEVKGG